MLNSKSVWSDDHALFYFILLLLKSVGTGRIYTKGTGMERYSKKLL